MRWIQDQKEFNMSKIIGFTGKKNSGKNTAADIASDYLAQRKLSSYHVSFAQTLKSTCIDLFGLDPNLVLGSDKDKNQLTDITWDNLPNEIREKYGIKTTIQYPHGDNGCTTPVNVVLNATGRMTIREVLQVVGTDIFRNMFDDNIWVKAAFNGLPNCNCIIFTDVRFPNEANAIKARNGTIIRINRPTHSIDSHISETALDNYPFDHIIHNKGTLQEFETLVKLVMKDIINV